MYYSVRPNGCWVWWKGKPDASGYMRHTVNYKTMLAHRFVYEALVGTIPVDTVLHHICENTKCVNPEHLKIVTAGEHRKEHINKATFPCGHPRTEENTRPNRSPRQGATCRECHRRYMIRYHQEARR